MRRSKHHSQHQSQHGADRGRPLHQGHPHHGHRRPDPLGRLIRGIRRHRAQRTERQPAPPSRDLPARLDALERDLREVRTRINALFFAVLTAALGDLVGRLVL